MLDIRIAKRTVIQQMALFSLLTLFVINAFAGTALALTENTWEAVGQRGFSRGAGFGLDLAFSPTNHQPYVIYEDSDQPHASGGSAPAIVKTFNGSSWVTVGELNAPRSGGGLIAFNPVTNEPYALHGVYADAGVTVKRFDGTSWIPVGAEDFASRVYNPTLTFSAAGTPYISYYTYDPDDSRHIIVRKFDGSSWVQVGDAFDNIAGSWTGLAVHPDTGEPYLLYFNSTSTTHMLVKKYDGSAWVTVGEGSDIGTGDRMSIKFNPVTHEPYIAYMTYTGSNTVVVKKYDGSAWVTVGSNWVAPYQYGGIDVVDFDFNPSTGQPTLAFASWQNQDKPEVIEFDGTSWHALENSEFTAGAAYTLSFAFDPVTHNPNVAYLDKTLGYKVSLLKYIPVDTIAPTTNATVSGQLVAGSTDTYIGATTVSLTATDNPDGMGLANTYVSVDGGTFSAVATTSFPYVLTITSLGAHTVQYYSTDMKGNQEATKTTTFTITQESQPTNGSISGMVFKDDNRNGVRDAGERAALWVLYIDANGNNRIDWGEKVAVTNCDGEYHFNNLSAGTYTVREIDRPLWIQTAPASGEHEVTLTAGQNATGKDFGNDLRW